MRSFCTSNFSNLFRETWLVSFAEILLKYCLPNWIGQFRSVGKVGWIYSVRSVASDKRQTVPSILTRIVLIDQDISQGQGNSKIQLEQMSEWNKPLVKLWSNWSLRSSLFIGYHLRRWRISPKFYPYTNKMREWNDEDCLGKPKMFSSLIVWIFYGIFEILQLEFEDRLSPLISELCFLDAAVLKDI